jgi:hypothetical protein
MVSTSLKVTAERLGIRLTDRRIFSILSKQKNGCGGQI